MIDPLQNPEIANAQIAAALADNTSTTAPKIAPQPLGFVRLAGGLVLGNDPNEVVYDAEVRELTGEDEEYIDRVRQGRPEAFTQAVLERGVVKIGDQPSTASLIGNLLTGDAQTLLVEVSRATYGDTLDFEGVICPWCQGAVDVTVNLTEDIPVHRLQHSADRFFEVPLRKGAKASVRLPRVVDIMAVTDEDLNDAERKTVFLSKVVRTITDAKGNVTPVAGGIDEVRYLGIADRKAITDAVHEKNKVGHAYNEVKFTHDSCGKEVPLPLATGNLFPGL